MLEKLHKEILAVCTNRATSRNVQVGIGIDTTSSPSDYELTYAFSTHGENTGAEYVGAVGLGYHYIAYLEYGGGADIQEWNSTGGVRGIVGWCMS